MVNMNQNPETVRISVSTEIKVPFLPTKRARKERITTETVKVPVEIKCPEEKDFPVAFEVTNYANLAEGVTKEYFRSVRDTEEFNRISLRAGYELHTEELRILDGKLYKPVHVNLSGSLDSTLYENSPDFIQNELEWYHNREHGHFNADEFNKNSSVVIDEIRKKNLNEKTAKIQESAEKFLMFGGKVWKECGEPYYSLYFMSDGSVSGWLEEWGRNTEQKNDFYDKSEWDFSALHQNEFIEKIKKYPKGKGRIPEVCIKVLIPEAVRLKDHIDIAREEERERNARFDTIVEKNSDPDVASTDSPAAVAGRFERAMKGYLIESKTKNPYNIARVILSTWEQDKKDKLNEYFKTKGICSKDALDKYFSETFGMKKNEKKLDRTIKPRSINYERGR